MNELLYFINFLKKRIYTLLLVPLVAMVICYLLTRQLPGTYRSTSSVATGIVDKTDQLFANDKEEQEAEINRKFANLIQLMRMKKVMDQVAYQLLIHDLSASQSTMFRSPSSIMEELTDSEKKQILSLLRKKYAVREELNTEIPLEAQANDLIESMNYDQASILDKLTITRLSTSDYINLEFEAETPLLSAFVANTVAEEFLNNYAARSVESANRSLEFLEKMMKQKLAELNQRMGVLKNYKIQNRVLNLNEQAKSLYGHIIDFETRREIAKKDVVAYRAALDNIDQRFKPTDRKYLESALTDINQRIASTREQLQSTNDRYIRSNFDPRMKARIDSIQLALTSQIQESSDKAILSPLSLKTDLVSHKLELEIALELAKNSISTIEKEVSRLDRKYNQLVPNEASIQEYETSIEIAGKEYMEALQRYNNARLESFSPITIKLIEKAEPGVQQPSKKNVLIIVAGLASFILCMFTFLVMYFLDNSIRTTVQLADMTGIPVLGRLNRISGGIKLLLLDTWPKTDKSISLFKDLIRSIRFEIDEDIIDPKIIAITSLSYETGKTDVTYSLAWAYSRINKKVLIIDGDFTNPEITKQAGMKSSLENFLIGLEEVNPDEVQILSTKGGDVSPLEITDKATIERKFADLKRHYDVILINAPALNALNKAKEWISLSDCVVGVFAFGRVLKDEDKAKLNYLKKTALAGWVLANTDYDIEPVGKTLVKL